jgi:transcriptional regulator with XRE-family HTH domain
MTFGQAVATLRRKRGLTQAELAKAAGLSLVAVSQQEQGRRTNLLFGSVVRLARALDVPVDEFAKCDEFRPARKPR